MLKIDLRTHLVIDLNYECHRKMAANALLPDSDADYRPLRGFVNVWWRHTSKPECNCFIPLFFLRQFQLFPSYHCSADNTLTSPYFYSLYNLTVFFHRLIYELCKTPTISWSSRSLILLFRDYDEQLFCLSRTFHFYRYV
jgi:hypothetical protein